MSLRLTLGSLGLLAALNASTIAAQAPAPRQTPSPDTSTRPAAIPADVASPDAIIAAIYDVISGPAGAKRNWDRMRSLFAQHARLIPTRVGPDGKASLRVWSIDDYIALAGPSLEQNGFFEREIGRTTETYGLIQHAFSTYESRRTADLNEKPIARGINSIQLFNDGTRWWVTSIMWDAERPGNPIPSKYVRP